MSGVRKAQKTLTLEHTELLGDDTPAVILEAGDLVFGEAGDPIRRMRGLEERRSPSIDRHA